jgi:phage tail-like protein
MARSIETDPYHKFRFHVVDPAGGNLDPVAGFMTVTMPNVAAEEPTYREGTFVWTQKYPGVPTVGDVSMTKGVFRRDSDFHRWILKCINGGQDYRADLIVYQYHISDEFGINGSPSRATRLLEAWAKDVKSTEDLDASSSEVLTQSLTLSVEQIVPELVPTS